MAGRLKEVRIVEFKEDFVVKDKVWYKKGTHAMNVTVADKLKRMKAPITVREAESEYKAMVEKKKSALEKEKEKQSK